MVEEMVVGAMVVSMPVRAVVVRAVLMVLVGAAVTVRAAARFAHRSSDGGGACDGENEGNSGAC